MQTCTLNGTWQLSAGHRSLESVDMQIPGTVLSGLLAAGKIKDPFYRTNEDATRALFWKDYVFTRTFDVDEEPSAPRKKRNSDCFSFCAAFYRRLSL